MASAIEVDNLSKQYNLGVINHGMLYKDIQSWLARKRGRPDPHGKIGRENSSGESDRFWALRGVSFGIEEGSRTGVIGENGAGKSTLLKILSRITAPTEGNVKIRGQIASLLEVGTGFHPELTGRENIFLNGAILGMKQREVARKLDEIVAFSEISQFIDTPVKRYSSGMYVRLAFAVAAHLDSDILLADEVLAVGDSAFQAKCLGKMEEVSRDQGRTVIFVSHNASAVRRLCRNALWLAHGRLHREGTIDEVLAAYLATSRTNTTHAKFDVEPERNVQIESVLLTADSNRTPIVSLPHTRPLRVVIRYVVAHWPRGAYVCLDLFDSEDRRLIWSSDVDRVDDLLQTRKPGTYEAVAVIPGTTLSPGRYSVTVAVYNPRKNIVYDARSKVVGVDIHDGGSFTNKLGISPQASLSIPLSWQTIRVGS